MGPSRRSASPEDSCSTKDGRCIATPASAASCFSRANDDAQQLADERRARLRRLGQASRMYAILLLMGQARWCVFQRKAVSLGAIISRQIRGPMRKVKLSWEQVQYLVSESGKTEKRGRPPCAATSLSQKARAPDQSALTVRHAFLHHARNPAPPAWLRVPSANQAAGPWVPKRDLGWAQLR